MEIWANKNNFKRLRTMVLEAINIYQKKKKKDDQTKMCVPPHLQLDIDEEKMWVKPQL